MSGVRSLEGRIGRVYQSPFDGRTTVLLSCGIVASWVSLGASHGRLCKGETQQIALISTLWSLVLVVSRRDGS